MKSFTYTVTSPRGFDVRLAGALVKETKKFLCTIVIEKDGSKIDVCRMFALIGLDIKCGDTITFIMEGEQEEKAAAAIQKFLQENM